MGNIGNGIMNTYLFSIHPKWCEKIFNGEKTIEVRKSAPKPPFKVVVYCTKGNKNKLYNNSGILTIDSTFCSIADSWIYPANGKVIGEFICDKVDKLWGADAETEKQTCLSLGELFAYANDKPIYGLHITDLKLYDKPRELGEFYRLDDSGDDCCCGCIYHEIPMNEYPCCKCNGDRKYLTHAPQSYMRIQV